MSTQLAIQQPVPIDFSAPRRVMLTDPDDQAQAQSRLAILEPIYDYRSDPARFAQLRLQDGKPITSFSRMVEYVSGTSGIGSATLYRWLRDFNNGGLPALADKLRSDKGRSRFFSTYPKAQWLAAYLFLECKASARVCHEAILRDAALIEVPPDDLPSYETVRSWLKQMPASLTVYARLGRKIYRERMAPYLKRGFTDVYANQVYVGDHAILDVECANDCFDNVEWGEPIRVRISAMLDYRSRCLVGASWCWEGSSRAIAACMRRAILKYGPPEHLYVDNGKDYRKVARGALPGYLAESPLAPANWWQTELDQIAATGFLARLGIAVTHCIPHHPQSKHVERFFRTLHERFDKLWPTYTSGTPFTRPEATEAAMMIHRRLLKAGRVSDSKHPMASQMIMACLAWIEEYNETPHTGEGMEGCSPREVFEANLNPNQKPTPDYATLSLLMAEREKRLVRECAVTLKSKRYVPADQTGWALMHEYNEREVLVVYDSADLNDVAVLDQDGIFVAWLQVEDLVKFAPYDKRTQLQIADSMAVRRRLEKGNRQALETITRAARANGALSPLEAMATRLQLSAGEPGVDIITQRKLHTAPDGDEPKNLNPGDATDRMIARLRRRTNASARQA